MTTIMGIVNVTPDSFSDGGAYLEPEAAIARGLELVAEGADLLDIGGESTRPGAAAVGAAEEIERVLPVIAGLASAGAQISIDTSKAEVAESALAAGARIVNDVTALRDPDMAGVCADAGAGLILMHMKGTPQTMQLHPTYENVVAEVGDYLRERLEAAVAGGVRAERVWLDPGIGFGKTVRHNLELIDGIGELRRIGRPIVLGASRKGFIGELTDRPVDARLGGSLAAAVLGVARGVDVLRVHDVSETRDAVAVAEAVLGRRPWRAEAASAGVGS